MHSLTPIFGDNKKLWGKLIIAVLDNQYPRHVARPERMHLGLTEVLGKSKLIT